MSQKQLQNKDLNQIELVDLNKDYKIHYIFNYLKGKRFLTSNSQSYNILIYDIHKDITNNKVIVYTLKHCMKYKYIFNSIMQLFEYFYNKGYHLEL